MSVGIAVAHLTVHLGGAPVLREVTLDVAPGEWVTVVGPNGAGKSTLLRALAGLAHGAGEITVEGCTPRAAGRRAWARTVAYVPQTPVVPPGIDVFDYVLLGRTPHIAPLGREGRRDVDAAHGALVALDLVAMAGRALETLSGGERQRAFLARALAQDAPVLLLDEPTAALDVGHQQDVLELVDDLRHRLGRTVVSTMHDLTLAAQYADRLVLLDRGRVVAAGTAAEVLDDAHLSALYGASVRVVETDGVIVVVPTRRSRVPTGR